MKEPVSVRQIDDIAWVTIDNPPVNATSTAVRAGLMQAVTAVQGARLAVLCCAGKTFVAGGDMSEFDAPPVAPHLPDVVHAIETSATPFVAAMHGSVLGGGLEIAMACAYRLAKPGTTFGLPEVNVGLIPGAGGTQRAPRLLGWDMAIDMACLGKVKSAEDLLALGAIDMITEDFETAIKSIGGPRPTATSQRAIAAPNQEDIERFETLVTKASKGAQAPGHNLSMLLKASAPYKDSQPEERALHLALRASDESRALRHIFFAERTASKPAILKDAKARDIDHVAIVGGGLMGCGIAMACLMAGLRVSVIEQSEPAAHAAQTRLAGLVDGAEKRGKLSASSAQELRARVICGAGFDLANTADLAIEAIYEDLDAKRSVFQKLAEAMRPDAILATNTSYLDPNEIFAGLPNPARCLGIHFFSPAHIMKLVEVVKAAQSSPEAIATAFRFAKRLRKTPVLSGVCDGFIGNRILSAYRRAAEYLLADGALPQDIDQAMRDFGLAMGPFEAQDMAGLQIGFANRRRQDATRPDTERYVDIGDQLVGMGRTGRRAGKGWYRYKDGARKPIVDPEVKDLITRYSDRHGIARQVFQAEDIQRMLLAAMANEGAQLVAEGIAQSAGDVDVVKCAGYGFPRWRGGPMQAAHAIGSETMNAAFAHLQKASPNSWGRAAQFPMKP